MTNQYGSIPLEGDLMDPEQLSYEEYDMKFLKSSTLTFQQKLERCIRASIPILIAVVFLSAASVLFVSGSVRCGGYPTDPKFCFDQSKSSSSTRTVAQEHYSPTILKDMENCDQNPGCFNLGLIGSCCPTEEGLQLGCCTISKEKDIQQSQSSTTTSMKDTKLDSTENSSMSAPSEQTRTSTGIHPSAVTATTATVLFDLQLCSQNPNCQTLGLIGDCCPTDTGIHLGCCSSSVGNEHNHTTSTNSTPTALNDVHTSSCTANPRCHDLGLVGDCCPTPEGIQLGCCSA